jgi:hypothetical protein
MARAKTPAWQLFEYVPKQTEDGKWIGRSNYNDSAGIRHPVKRSGKTKTALQRAMRLAVADARERSEQLKKDAAQAQEEQLKRDAAAQEEHSPNLADVGEKWLAVKKPPPVQIDESMQTGTPPTDAHADMDFV